MTFRSRWLGIVALALVPTSGSSLGLGDIKLNSYLNERLDAEIYVSAAGTEELDTLQVQVASRDVFERFGVERIGVLDQLTRCCSTHPCICRNPTVRNRLRPLRSRRPRLPASCLARQRNPKRAGLRRDKQPAPTDRSAGTKRFGVSRKESDQIRAYRSIRQ